MSERGERLEAGRDVGRGRLEVVLLAQNLRQVLARTFRTAESQNQARVSLDPGTEREAGMDDSPSDGWADHSRGQDSLERLLRAELTELGDASGGNVFVKEAASRRQG